VHGEFTIDGATCLLEERTLAADQPATVGHWRDLTARAVLALQRDGSLAMLPDDATPLHAGDRLTCLRLERHSPKADKAVSAHARRSGPGLRKSAAIALREWWHDVPAAIRGALFTLLGVVVGSVLLFRHALGITLVDAFYFVVTTVTTVGYGDFNLMNAPPWLKLFGVFVMLCGAAIMATLFGILTDLVLRSRLQNVFTRSCAGFTGHVIVAGLDSLGFRLVKELLHDGEAVVAIAPDADDRFLPAARELVPVIPGNARNAETLRKAGVANAKAILAVTGNDLDNLSIGLATKRAHASSRVVVRVFDSHLAEKLRRSLGVDEVLSVSKAVAPTFVAAVLCPAAHQGFLLNHGLAVIFSGRGDESNSQETGATPLFAMPPGETTYRPVAGAAALPAGTAVIGLRWFPFQNPEPPNP
jgi:voltage-gated potassium channel Kch